MNRIKNRTAVKVLACYLAVALFVIGIAEKSYAGFSPSEVMNLSPFERSVDLKKIQNALEIKAVSERLKQLGFNKDEIQTRMSELSDQQLHQLATRVDQLRVGGDGAGIVIAVLVIAILVVLLVFLVRRV